MKRTQYKQPSLSTKFPRYTDIQCLKTDITGSVMNVVPFIQCEPDIDLQKIATSTAKWQNIENSMRECLTMFPECFERF